MRSKYTLADYVFQFITIAAGVLLALFASGLNEFYNNRQLVAQARENISRELADNKKDLEATLSAFPRDRESLTGALKFADEMLTVRKTAVTSIELHYNLADLSASSWHTAERTGALGLMAYDEVQKLSKLYDFQDLFVEQQRLILQQLSAASAILQGDFNPDKPNPKDLELFRERVMQLKASLTIQEDFAKRLAENYAEALKQ
jgi:hypothetical protein